MNKKGGNSAHPASLPELHASISRQGSSLHSAIPATVSPNLPSLSQNKNKPHVLERQNMAGGKQQTALSAVSR